MTGTPFRLPSGGRIDRAKAINFSFDGRRFVGCQGDTLASALLANGVHLVGRSFKYHRPRGILSAGADEPNALVGVGRAQAAYTPNLRATQIELYEGLVAESQNRFPSLAFDAGAVNDLLWPFFPAGFYYKTFLWPKRAWSRLYEPIIRRAAGLGRAPTAPDEAHYAQRYAHCDVLVVGGGPAGLAAARAAASAGASVILCDEQNEFGGSLLASPKSWVEGVPAVQWRNDALAFLGRCEHVTLLSRTTAFGYYPHNMVGLAQRLSDHLPDAGPALPRERLWQVRARQVVIASGAHERPLVFPDNDRPGIMLAEAARVYAVRYGVKPGNTAVIVTAHDSGYRAALDLAEAGVSIAAIADVRADPLGPYVTQARQAGLKLRTAMTVCGTQGRRRVSGVDIARIAEGKANPRERIACDLLLMCGGWTPSLHLFSQSRGSIRWDAEAGAFLPDQPAEATLSAGACRGVFGLDAAVQDGLAAGAKAAGSTASFAAVAITSERGFAGALPYDRKQGATRAFVDFQNDATAKDIQLAVREGFRSIEHIKRYTTTGMATDQGKTSNINALGIAAAALGVSLPAVGLTTFRPPYTPVTFGSFAGRARGTLFDPVRTTPIHGWAEARGAVFEDVGLWKRARYFPAGGEDMHQAVSRECRAVRASAGIFDASTLGKIEVVGPDAAEFLNRIYINAWTKLAPGACRYGVMLREDGTIMDDGVIGRLAPDRFHVTTTTGGAAAVLQHMEDYLQTEWPDLKVWLTSTTEQWAVIAVQGPAARHILAPLVEGIDIAPGAMPHMSLRTGQVCGVEARLFRVSFTGELGFEVNVPAGHARAVWDAIFAAGASFGITPYGTETMHVLRAEKGYIIVGQETDGTVTPDDAGLGWAIGKAKPDFVGKRSLARAAMAATGRKQVVGLATLDGATVLEECAQIVPAAAAPRPMAALGHVTSAYWSAVLGRPVALGLVAGGRARLGETLHVPMPGGAIAVRVVSPVAFDPEGTRLDG
jgi:sarcosine oxidase subunit alpha